MAKSIRDLLDSKTLKRTDQGLYVKLEDIHFREGFNPRDDDQRFRDSIEEDAQFTLVHGIKNMPQLKVEPRDEGGVWATDGHRRPLIVRRAIELGADLKSKDGHVWMPVKPFTGTVIDRHLEPIVSQRQLKLKPIEAMRKIKELIEGVEGEPPMSIEDVALRTGFKKIYIHQLLKLSEGDDSVHAMVADEQISADLASIIVRTHGENAAAVIQEEKAKAEAQGKRKITRSTIEGPTYPKSIVSDIAGQMRALVKVTPKETASILEQFRSGKITDPNTPVTLPVRELLALTMCIRQLDEVEADQKRRADKRLEKNKKEDSE